MHIRNKVPQATLARLGSGRFWSRLWEGRYAEKSQSDTHARPKLLAAVLTVLGVAATIFAANPASAGAGWGDTTNPTPDAAVSAIDSTKAIKVRTYYANSPMGMQFDALTGLQTRDTGTALRKFVDPLPTLGPNALSATWQPNIRSVRHDWRCWRPCARRARDLLLRRMNSGLPNRQENRKERVETWLLDFPLTAPHASPWKSG